MKEAGYSALLVGELLVKSTNRIKMLSDLRNTFDERLND